MIIREELLETGGNGIPFMILGISLCVIAVFVLATATGALILKDKASDTLIKFGMLLISSGVFIIFDSEGIELFVSSYTIRLYTWYISMMMAVYWLGVSMYQLLIESRRGMSLRTADAAMAISGIATTLAFILMFCIQDHLCEVLKTWVVLQALTALIMLYAMIASVIKGTVVKYKRYICFYILAFTALILDFAGVGATSYSQGTFSKILLIIFIGIYFQNAVNSILNLRNSEANARRLSEELEENKINIMLSQIQPHFLYNVLGTIRGLCRKDPELAREALGDFSDYLRGNINVLEDRRTIYFPDELRHVETYVRLEQMRFSDKLNVVFDIQEREFFIPPLTVQPLVENAIKHGIFEKEEGGTVIIKTEREADSIIISVRDDGIGFDAERYYTERYNGTDPNHRHVGLLNVKRRLELLTGGSLTVASSPGQGTEAIIKFRIDRTEEGEKDKNANFGS